LVVIAISVFTTSNANATIWSFDEVLFGIDGGYGYSSFHDASGNVMSGAIFGNMISSASGTYNDVSGDFLGIFAVDPAGADPNTASLRDDYY